CSIGALLTRVRAVARALTVKHRLADQTAPSGHADPLTVTLTVTERVVSEPAAARDSPRHPEQHAPGAECQHRDCSTPHPLGHGFGKAGGAMVGFGVSVGFEASVEGGAAPVRTIRSSHHMRTCSATPR